MPVDLLLHGLYSRRRHGSDHPRLAPRAQRWWLALLLPVLLAPIHPSLAADTSTPPASAMRRASPLPPAGLPALPPALDTALPDWPPQWRQQHSVPQPADASAPLTLRVGDTHVRTHPGLTRIAVGDGSILQATATDEHDLLLFGRAPGTTSVVLWQADGSHQSLAVTVVAGSVQRTQAELQAFLSRIPQARSTVVGDKIIVEGDDLSAGDQARLAALATHYPQILDFTSAVGWDRMALIDVQVLELPRSRLQELGVRWSPTSTGGLQVGALWEAGGRSLQARPGSGPLQAAFPAASTAYAGLNGLLSAQLEALVKEGEAVLLAQPQLMARSGATASFLAGGELPYTHIDANGNTSTVFKPYGVTLDVTPHIERNGTIRASIAVEVSAVDPVLQTPSGPALRTRRATTEFNVRSGQTLVLGGFVSREQVEDVEGVPGLSRIPGLGALFRTRRTERRDTELTLFVTPVVVGAHHPDLITRQRQGQALMDAAFPEPLRLQTPVRHNPFLLETP